MTAASTDTVLHEVLSGGGALGARMRALEWEETPLGAVATWPQSLRSALSICLGSRFPIAIYWGSQLTLIYNDAWSPIPGTKHPWALGRPAQEVWPEIWDTIGPLFEQVMTTGEATYAEDSLLPMHRHGYTEECYFNFTFSPIRGEGGHLDGVFNAVIETTFRVISDRRTHILRDLAEQTAAARSPEEACVLAVKVLGAAQHDVPFCALYLADTHGVSARLAAFAGLPAGSTGVPETVSLLESVPGSWPLHEVSRSGRVEPVVNLATRFGMTFPGGAWPESSDSALVAPVAAMNGRASGFLVLGVSPRRAIDEDYRQFAGRAAAQVATVVSAAAEYEAERKRAAILAELNHAKSAFFSNVSHEFRTPLTLMLGPTEELLSGAPGELSTHQRALLDTVHRNELRLGKLVNTLLDFSRIEAGGFQAVYEPTDLAAFTHELASVFRSAMEKAELTYSVNCRPLSQPAFVDHDLWEKVVFNLLSNAFKFTLQGGVELALEEREGAAILTVRDTGSGIAQDEIPKLFSRFYRVEGVRSRSHEGSGIGLAMVNELVKLHGGSVGVESAPGEGTRFTVSIPLGEAHLPHDRRRNTAASRDARTGSKPFVEEALRWLSADQKTVTAPRLSTPGAHVLVADDNSDMRDYVARLLREDGLEVTCVANGLSALEVVHDRSPDLVLTDVMMPGLDGMGLLRALRRDARYASIPVLMLSARAGEEARIEGLAAGADDYVVKPFAAKELVARVRSHLEGTKLRRVAEAERNRFRALLSEVPAIVNFLRGPELVFEFIHPRALEVLRGRAVIGKPLLDALPEFRDQEYPALLRQVVETGQRVEGHERLVLLDDGKGGTAKTYWNSVCLPVRDGQGRTEGVMTFDVEVTEQVEARRSLEVQAEQLAQAKREAEQARAVAESANRSKDEFLALLGHELRNPLAPISTALSLMDLRGVQQCERERAIIGRQVEHLTRLVDDLLDVSRIARGKITIAREPIELAEVVARALETASPLFEARQQRVLMSVPARGLIINADASRMQQVISNLFTNAAKYTDPKGEISIVAAVDGDEVGLRVLDSGMGIEPDMLHRVFDLFAQEAQALDRARGGLGLGLAIVRSIVELHGGTVSVRSEGRGKGSEFEIRLPLAPSPIPVVAASQPPMAPRAAPSTTGLRVLLVDDNADALEMLALTLEECGYEIRTASDGPSALRALEHFTPNLALLDIGLPGMDGYELARNIRERLNGSALRLVALTGYGQDEDRKRSKDAGFDHHMVKPLELSKLLSLLQS